MYDMYGNMLKVSLVDAFFRGFPRTTNADPKTVKEDGPWLTHESLEETAGWETPLKKDVEKQQEEDSDRASLASLTSSVTTLTSRSSFDLCSLESELEELREELRIEKQMRTKVEAENRTLRNKVNELSRRNMRLQRKEDVRAQVGETEEDVRAVREAERIQAEAMRECEFELERIAKESRSAFEEMVKLVEEGLKKVEEEEEVDIEIDEWKVEEFVFIEAENEEEEDDLVTSVDDLSVDQLSNYQNQKPVYRSSPALFLAAFETDNDNTDSLLPAQTDDTAAAPNA